MCIRDRDTIEGFIHIKDLYWSDEQISGTDYDNLPVREIIAVSESLSVDRLLQIMQDKETKFALVVDEYGGTAGIVTSSDVMTQIVGNIDDDEYIPVSYTHLDVYKRQVCDVRIKKTSLRLFMGRPAIIRGKI